MIKVECVSCKSPYDVDERRIPEKGMKMRCPKCNTSFMVSSEGVTSAIAGAGGRPSIGIAMPPMAAGAGGPLTLPVAPPLAASSVAPGPFLGKSAAGHAASSAFNRTLVGNVPAEPAEPAISHMPASLQALDVPAANDAESSESEPSLSIPPALADLPALKPPATKTLAWGSIAPPGGGLPRGTGAPTGAPLHSPNASSLKAASAGAFGATAKQTLVGQGRRAAEALPATDPSRRPEQPSAAGAIELADLPAPKPANQRSLPDLDLPAVKPPTAAGAAFGARRPPAPRAPIAPPVQREIELPLVDLPAAKLRAGAPSPQALQPANTVDLEGFSLRESQPLSPDTVVDLPGTKPTVDLPALKAGAKAPQFGHMKPTAEQPLVDLPAPRGIDLPAPKAGGGTLVGGHAPTGKKPPLAPDPGFADLPAPKPKPAPPRPPPASQGFVDLPAPVPGGRTLAHGAPPPHRATQHGQGDVDLPALKGALDLPALHGSVDLPAPRGAIDLPAPKGAIDLPAPRGAVDLPAPKGVVDLPIAHGFADLPTTKGVTDLLVARGEGGFGELDLPVPKSDEVSFGDLELPDLPVRQGFGNLELPVPRAGGDVMPPKAATFQGVGPGGQDETSFGDLDLGGPEEPNFGDIRQDDVVAYKRGGETSTPPALQGAAVGGDAEYGEAGLLDDDSSEDMEFGMSEGSAEDNLGLPPELLRRNKGEVEGEAPEVSDAARGKRTVRMLIGVAVGLVLLVGSGALLGLTDYGFFGQYFWERFLPEAADAHFASEAIQRSEKTASSDTYRDVQRSLSLLGESRHKAGLNRELLTRSLLHEALFMVRFGPNATSSAHIAAIFARLEERHGLAPGMNLARAAEAMRRQAYPDVERFLALAKSESPQDAYVGLLGGELALRQGKLLEAEKAFAEALRNGAGARAQWGLARVALARTDKAAQQAPVADTLKLSPLHAEARIADARLLWDGGQQERALGELRQALGQEPVGDQFIWTSKPAKAAGFSLLGYVNEARGHLTGARKAYDDALASDPFMVEALLGSGRVLLRERRWNDALARFESALNLAQKSGSSLVLSGRRADVEARLGQSRAQLALNRAPDAKANLTALMKDNPNDPEIVRAAGQAEDALSNYASAEELLNKAVELAPSTFASYLALAQHYFKRNRADKASETLNDAASKVEENVEMRRMLGQSELARNRIDSAVHEFARAVELDPQDLEAQFGLATAYRRRGQLDQARIVFEKIAARDPQYAGLALERGQLLEAQGDYENAAALYRAARERDPSDVALELRLGAAQVESGHLDEAELTLQQVMRELPNSADAEYFTGRLALARGRGADALTHFDRALALDTTQGVYHLYAARAALDMSNLGRALEEAEAALARDATLGDAYWIRGVVRMRSGAVKDALKDAKRALELNPARYDAYALRAECYDELRKLPDAAAAYRVALEKDPTRGEWWYKLGRLSLDMGERGQAGDTLEKAMRAGDKVEPMPYWLPDAYRLAGELARVNNRKQAVVLFKRYLAIAPDGALDREDVRKLLISWDVDLTQD
jgi:predicted Zn finger-like uncharacterized protein